MKIAKVREMDDQEIDAQLHDLDDQMFHLRLQMRMGQTDGLKKYRTLRKDRARMFTIRRERELASQQTSK